MITSLIIVTACMASLSVTGATGCGDKKQEAKDSQPTQAEQRRKAGPRKADTRPVALAFGTRLAIAAVTYSLTAGDKPDSANLRQARMFANRLQVVVPALPARATDATAMRVAVRTYLRGGAGKALAKAVTGKHGNNAGALFRFGIERHLLNVDYAGTSSTQAADSLTAFAKAAGIPSSLVASTSKMLREGKPKSAITASFARLRGTVANHLRSSKP